MKYKYIYVSNKNRTTFVSRNLFDYVINYANNHTIDFKINISNNKTIYKNLELLGSYRPKILNTHLSQYLRV